MSEVLEFDFDVSFGEFALEAAAEVPLTGITALSGPSGSGKTTLLRAIAGLEPLLRGHVHFAGQDWTGLSPAARGVGYVFQDARLFPHLDVAANLAYGARRRGTPQGLVEAVIEALDLGPLLHRVPATLSGGETRRVALGRALACAPRILLMDEPLTGLDRARKAALMPYIARAVAGFGVPALYVTHSAGEIGFLADRTLSIAGGRLVGWSGAAPRLIAQVIDVAPGQVCLAVGRQSVWTDGHGAPGEIWAVPLGQDFFAATEPPGQSNAALTLKALVLGGDVDAGQVFVDIDGQQLTLGWPVGRAGPDPETRLWLSLPRVLARPVQTEPGLVDSD